MRRKKSLPQIPPPLQRKGAHCLEAHSKLWYSVLRLPRSCRFPIDFLFTIFPSPAMQEFRVFGLRGTIAAPLVTALVYGFLLQLPHPGISSLFYWQSPLVFSCMAGLLIAFACRPVLSKMGWSRPMALMVALSMLLLIGPPSREGLAHFISWTGAAPYPLSFRASPWGELFAVLGASIVMSWLYCRNPGAMTFESVRGSFIRAGMGRVAGTVVMLGCLMLAWNLLAGWLDAKAVWNWGWYGTGVLAPNAWLRLTQTQSQQAAAILLGTDWLTATLTFAPLALIALNLKAVPAQMTLVLGMSLFVLGTFAPMVMDQPYPSAQWLTLATAHGVLRAAVLGAVAAWRFAFIYPANSSSGITIQ